MKKAVIIGAGPAGLTAAFEILRLKNIHSLVFEQSDQIGGLSKTVLHNGNRLDIGGHRFYSKNEKIVEWWLSVMPLQGYPSKDEIGIPNPLKGYSNGGPNPEISDQVMLVRKRISRIYFLGKFFDYPISISYTTFKKLGFVRTLRSVAGFLKATISKRNEKSLEDFYINRFGKHLYKLFFEKYTEKVWGLHPAQLSANWGRQRIKGLSLATFFSDLIYKQLSFSKQKKKVETSLIEEFFYPKLGPGQFWELIADKIGKSGGKIIKNCPVQKIVLHENRVISVKILNKDKQPEEVRCDYLLSSMPINELVSSFEGILVPDEIIEIAKGLQYRDFMTVGLLLPSLKMKNYTGANTFLDNLPDTWIYIQEHKVKIGRLQIFNNWSPYMLKDFENTVWLGLEYFCNENDSMWNMSDQDFIELAINELDKLGMIEKDQVIDSVRIKVRKAYPSYFGTYDKLNDLRSYLNQIENLFLIGRNGQHRYNNMDHSMLTAIEAVNNIQNGVLSKDNIWAVNTEDSYIESKTN